MPCLITTTSATKKYTRKNNNNNNNNKASNPKQIFLNLKAPSNNVKLQSEKSLIHKFNFLNYTSDGINETR